MTPKDLMYIGLVMLNPYFILLPIGNLVIDILRLEGELREEAPILNSPELESLKQQNKGE